MSLKYRISKEEFDKLPEAMQAEYKANGTGQYQLDVDGAEDATGIKKNRDELMKEKKALQEQLEAMKDLGDPEKIKEALAKIREIEEKKLIDAGEIDKLLEARTENMRKDFESKLGTSHKALDEANAQAAKLKERLNREVIDARVLEAANQAGMPRPEAMADILSRGRGVWQVDEEGNPVPMNADGTVILGPDAKNPLTIKEWAAQLSQSAGHLFMPSTGGGSKGSKTGKSGYSSEELDAMSPSQMMAAGRAAQDSTS